MESAEKTKSIKSSLSAGEIIRAFLLADPEVTGVTDKVYPVATSKAELPYIIYRRASLETYATKGRSKNDEVGIEVYCYAAQYGHSVDLAERVRASLDGAQGSHDDLQMRSCYLADSEEDWDADAFVQKLVFAVRIENKNY